MLITHRTRICGSLAKKNLNSARTSTRMFEKSRSRPKNHATSMCTENFEVAMHMCKFEYDHPCFDEEEGRGRKHATRQSTRRNAEAPIYPAMYHPSASRIFARFVTIFAQHESTSALDIASAVDFDRALNSSRLSVNSQFGP